MRPQCDLPYVVTPQRSRCGELAVPLCVVLSSLLFSGPRLAQADDGSDVVHALIRQAGNVEDDDARLEILKQLQARPGLDTQLRADVNRMVAFVDRWQHDNGGGG